MITLAQSFGWAFDGIQIDSKFAKRVEVFSKGFVQRSQDLTEFFGGNLLGTHRIWFKDAYLNDLFENTFQVEYATVERYVRQATTIDHSWKVGGDVTNLTLMYMIHRAWTTTSLDAKQRDQLAFHLAMIFFYRCMCILISDQFNFTANMKVAQEAYGNLSMKFQIKRLGTWNKVMAHRARELTNPNTSIHYKSLLKFNVDSDVVRAVADSQGRIRGIIREYYGELAMVAERGGGVGIAYAIGIDLEGDEAVAEKPPGPEVYVRYLRQILLDPQTFIRDDLLDLVSRTNSNTSKRSVREVLEWMSATSFDAAQFKRVDDFMSRTMVLCSYFLTHNIDYKRRRDYGHVLKTLKDLFLSTRSVDPDLIAVRDIGKDIVEGALCVPIEGTKKVSKISDSLMKATRTAVILYLCILAISGSK